MESPTLRITEIYKSIQGESTWAGRPCTFIRLTGCPLRCNWCDTVYGFEGGEDQTVDQVVGEAKKLGVRLVELTGGEPLAQESCIPLAEKLVEEGFELMIETSGSESIARLPPETHIIMDLKCPDSRMESRNDYRNIDLLKKTDEIKFVVASRSDFDWACDKVRDLDLGSKAVLLASPAFGLVKPDALVEWILESNLPFRLNLQIHKFIWSPRKKGV